MDDQTKELALKYMKSVSEKTASNPKFPLSLPESRQKAQAMLLGCYGAVVQSRDIDMQMDGPTISKVERVVKWMYDSRKRGLLLCGTLGNGKTTMLRAMSRMFGMHAVYMEAQAIYDFFKQNQCLPNVPSNNVLLIDDLGVEPATYNDFGEIRYPLAEMLMQRYKSNSTTIIATNKTFEDLGQTYGDRVHDRMKEMFASIAYVEPSYRK